MTERTLRRALVEALPDAGLRVVVITPRQVKGLRSRYSGSGAKSDAPPPGPAVAPAFPAHAGPQVGASVNGGGRGLGSQHGPAS